MILPNKLDAWMLMMEQFVDLYVRHAWVFVLIFELIPFHVVLSQPLSLNTDVYKIVKNVNEFFLKIKKAKKNNE